MYLSCSLYAFFFFKQKTAYEMRISDWSSDVCSSDLDQHHLDTKGFKLLRQRFRQAFHSEFRGVVNAGSRMANESRDRREVDQHALALPQVRKGSPGDADKPEEIGFHHSAIIVVAALFEWTEDAEGRIVHQQIGRAHV